VQSRKYSTFFSDCTQQRFLIPGAAYSSVMMWNQIPRVSNENIVPRDSADLSRSVQLLRLI
jgi:hypothetical protein